MVQNELIAQIEGLVQERREMARRGIRWRR